MALSQKNKGDLMIGISAIIVLLGVGLVGYAGYYGYKHHQMLGKGSYADARVTAKQSETSGSGRSRGTSYRVSVEFAAKSGKPLSDSQAASAAANAPPPKSGSELVDRLFSSSAMRALTTPPDTQAELAQMNYERYSRLNRGDIIPVVFMAADTSYVVELQTLRAYSSWPPLLSGLLILALGGAMMWWGFRKRAA
jgi:hypothetical protein